MRKQPLWLGGVPSTSVGFLWAAVDPQQSHTMARWRLIDAVLLTVASPCCRVLGLGSPTEHLDCPKRVCCVAVLQGAPAVCPYIVCADHGKSSRHTSAALHSLVWRVEAILLLGSSLYLR